MLGLAVAFAAFSQTVAAAAPPPDGATAEIVQLERQWGEAFVKRDFPFLEKIVAPEFRLVVASDQGGYGITRRAEWMKNSKAFTHKAFAVETVDVNLVGDTAIATAQGLWTVAKKPGEEPRPIRFFVTDTWVKHGGQWQVVHRFSQRLPKAPWPPSRR